MVHVMISFQVQESRIKEAIKYIQTFERAIQKYEPDTLLYKSFQQAETPNQFVHVMSFKNETARKQHSQSDYCLQFVQQLYPLCTEPPKAIRYNEIL